MRRLRICDASLLVLLIAATASAGDDTSARSSLVNAFGELHRMNWNSVDATIAARALKVPLSVEPSEGVVPCHESAFYNATIEGARLVLEFRQRATQNKCSLKLTRATVVFRVSNNEAHMLEARLTAAVKAGGRSCPNGESNEYEWRSSDSQVRFVLQTAILIDEGNANPSSPAKLRISLTQVAATRSEVADLPFERGFFPVCP